MKYTQLECAMRFIKLSFPVILVISLLPHITALGQNQIAAEDTAFQDYMNDAWQEIREAEMSDSLQKIYSDEFYAYFREHPETETGEEAFAHAFLMWGNIGRAKYLEEALEKLEYDSHLWQKIILPVENIYYRNADIEQSEYSDLMDYLYENLTNPLSRSEVILNKLRSEMREDDPGDNAIEFARELVELDADEFYVKRGLGFLHEIESLSIGQPAPDFEATTIFNNTISLEEFQGQFVLLEFWATWCGPCFPEIPHLKTLHDKYGDEDLKIIGISLDREKEALTEVIEEEEMEWPQIFVEDGWYGDIPSKYNVSGIPRMYILDPEGNIAARDLRGEEMVNEIERMIDQYQE